MCQNECRPTYSPNEYKRFSYLFWRSDLAAIISPNFDYLLIICVV